MKLLGSTESKITKDKNGEKVPHLEIVELVLVHCNLVNNDCQQDSRILYTFVPNKTFGSLLEISPTNQVFLKTFNSEFQEVKIWFTEYGFMPFARNFNVRYSKSLMDASKTIAKTAGKKILKETAKATGDLIGNKIADKITAKPSKKSHDDEVINGIPKERYISPKERQKIIDELKLA